MCVGSCPLSMVGPFWSCSVEGIVWFDLIFWKMKMLMDEDVKECLEKYGSYFRGTDSVVVMIWTDLYIKIDGCCVQMFFLKICPGCFT